MSEFGDIQLAKAEGSGPAVETRRTLRPNFDVDLAQLPRDGMRHKNDAVAGQGAASESNLSLSNFRSNLENGNLERFGADLAALNSVQRGAVLNGLSNALRTAGYRVSTENGILQIQRMVNANGEQIAANAQTGIRQTISFRPGQTHPSISERRVENGNLVGPSRTISADRHPPIIADIGRRLRGR